ncbi:hypothetical protein Gotur_015131 [Gossypium turneri]
MEDAASLCVEALEVVPQARFTFESKVQGHSAIFHSFIPGLKDKTSLSYLSWYPVVNGGEKVSDWKECLTRLIGKTEQ